MKKKGLVFAEFPAPYRVKVFEELAKVYNLTVFFDRNEDEERHNDFWIKDSFLHFTVLDNRISNKKYKKCLKNIKEYDFILDYNIGSYNGVRLMLSGIINKIPCFINNDGAPFLNKNILKTLLKRYLIKNAALCFASGESAKKYFVNYRAKEQNIKFHNFTSLNEEDILIKPLSNKEKQLLKRELGLSDKKVIITVGRFMQLKGFDVLLEAWKNIKGDGQLLLIGGGSLEQSFINYINSNKLVNVIIIGYKPKKELFKYLKAADIFVLPTRRDVWGLVINEAMACGLPVISTENCVAAQELIEDGINGYIVPVDDSLTLGDKILKILDNDNLAKSMSINNINKIQGHTMANIGKNHIKDINEYFNK